MDSPGLPAPRDADIGPQINLKRLRGRLAEENMTQTDFSRLAGISDKAFSIIMSDRNTVPTLRMRYKIAVALTQMGLADGVVFGRDALVDFGQKVGDAVVA